MTSDVKVTAHCADDKEVVFGMTTVPQEGILPKEFELSDLTVLQNGESSTKYIYDDKVAVILERKKKSLTEEEN